MNKRRSKEEVKEKEKTKEKKESKRKEQDGGFGLNFDRDDVVV